jgi:hypothetical protein
MPSHARSPQSSHPLRSRHIRRCSRQFHSAASSTVAENRGRDGTVNDAAILAAHWGEGVEEESVPEPGSLALLAGMAVMGVFCLRRRKA